MNLDFKERITVLKKALTKNMIFSDKLDMRNPQVVAEFAHDVYEDMRVQELVFKIDPNYVKKVQLPEVKETSRAFLVAWMIDVHRKFRLRPETLFVGVHLLDRFMSLQKVRRSHLHIVGVACLLISTKYEEIYPPDLQHLLKVSEFKFTRAEVVRIEEVILKTLEFDVTAPSAYRFLERFRRMSTLAAEDEVFFFAQYLMETTLLDVSLYQFRPSEIAAACLIISAKHLKRKDVWTRDLEAETQMSDRSLAPVVSEVRGFTSEVNPKFMDTLKYKFLKPEFCCVAGISTEDL